MILNSIMLIINSKYDSNGYFFINIIKDIPDIRADQHFRSQYHDLYHNDKRVPDFVGKFETLSDGWKDVQMIVKTLRGMDLPDLPHVNNTPPMDIKVTSGIEAIIKKRYARDYEAFGYD